MTWLTIVITLIAIDWSADVADRQRGKGDTGGIKKRRLKVPMVPGFGDVGSERVTQYNGERMYEMRSIYSASHEICL